MHEPAFWYRPASWMSRLLMPLAALYGGVAGARMQRQGIEAAVPVLCVGNYHVGGAGKTPTALALVQVLRDLGETPVVLSRGYGGRLRGPVMVDVVRHVAKDVGDEPLMLSKTVPVAVARERIGGLALACSRGATVIVMDDGFQNPAIAKDAALIVIDAHRGLGNACVFPAGPLRAPLLSQILHTDALIVIGEGKAADGVAATIVKTGKPIFTAHLKARESSLALLRGKRVLAFAGIGDPDRFFRTLGVNGIEVAGARAFADHYPFARNEIEPLVAQAQRDGLTLVTTEKDMARLRVAGALPPYAQAIVPFEVNLEFDDAPGLSKFVSEQLARARDKKFQKKI